MQPHRPGHAVSRIALLPMATFFVMLNLSVAIRTVVNEWDGRVRFLIGRNTDQAILARDAGREPTTGMARTCRTVALERDSFRRGDLRY